MSNIPNREDIRIMKSHIDAFNKICEEQCTLTERIQSDTRRLASIEDDAKVHRKAILDLMSKMDVSSSGNSGFENRVISFLSMLLEE